MTGHRSLSRRHVLTRAAAAAAVMSAAGSAVHADTAAPPPLSVYGRLPMIGKVALSPDGTKLAVVVHKGTDLVIEQRDLVTGKTAAVTLAGNMVPSLIWADNETVFVVTSMTSHSIGVRYESWIGFLLTIPTGRHYQLYSDLTEYGTALVGDFHRVKMGGKYSVTASNYSGGAANYTVDYSTALYAFSAENYHSLRLDEDTRRIMDWAVDGAGKVVARSEFDEDSKVWNLRYKGRRGWEVIYTLKAVLDTPVLKGLGRDGKSVLLLMKNGPLTDSYVELSEDGTFSEPLARNASKTYPLFSPVSNRLIGFGDSDGLDTYSFFDPDFAGLPARVKTAVPARTIELSDFAEDPRHMLVYTEDKGNAGAYYHVDLSTGTRALIGKTYPDLPAEWVFEKQPLTYQASDGLDIPAFITLPKDRAPKALPLVVLVHGGPESFDDARFDYMAQALASRGYAVLQANYRGSGGYGRAYVARGYGEFGRKMQTDLSDGVRHLVAQGVVDARRVAIAGGSYGGYAALAGAAFDPGVYNCAVSMSGICDIRAYMNDVLKAAGFNGKSRTVLYWKRYLGDEAQWDDISPLMHTGNIRVPVLLLHGRDDAVVPIEQSYDMRDALQKASKPVEFVMLKEEDHYLSREATRIQTLEAMLAFLLRYNPPA